MNLRQQHSTTFLPVAIDPLTMQQAVKQIRFWIDGHSRDCRFVVTPNVDHVVGIYRRPTILSAYSEASMTLADGWPLVSCSALSGTRLPERVAGSDLLPAVCQSFQSDATPLRIFLLGGKPGVAERAAARIHSSWPQADVVGSSSPPYGFEDDANLNRELCELISNSHADLLVICLGFPKQELWVSKYRDQLKVPVALCLGATIDFLAGEQQRAPRWIRSMKLEWFHRLASDPKRLASRYLIDAVYFPWICATGLIKTAIAKRKAV